ncbi:MAG: GNAT family N-acetyltransferase [Gammaproteobacteria bacterium]|nr:MAG: GNAT family N-acetyltransferase [Gammaproteobacteria bacterium]
MNITQAGIDDVDVIATLFDDYRQFYQQASDPDGAKAFLSARIAKKESVIFLATNNAGEAIGFTQLYPSFSSVSLQRRWIVNDLFVSEFARQMGVANQLMQTAEAFAKATGAGSLSLSTAVDNHKAQALYEKRQWQKNTTFYHYHKTVD